MSKKLLAVLFSSALVLGACGDDSAEEPADTNEPATEEPAGEEPAGDGGGQVDAAAAEKIFSQSCAGCHGQNLEGGAGPKLDDVGAQLSKDEILEVIQNGQGIMQGNIIKGEDADLVASWLATMK